ncbi:hypothetical protein NDU88_003719 [Pleurodeles waltl]|uniref:Uncharacterized protein n=1 Tax=Pleurodeles waltl TaxID=8319 RepID=A0AAV7VGL5_PLEWA|nr:hypothetical protein NDU88_003719 [Pleurodeles waltl]
MYLPSIPPVLFSVRDRGYEDGASPLDVCCPCFLRLDSAEAFWRCASARVLGLGAVPCFFYHADEPLGGSFVRHFVAGAAEYAGSAPSESGSRFHLLTLQLR